MSFASNVKQELIAGAGELAPCCVHALRYGLFLFARQFSVGEVHFTTESADIAAFALDHLAALGVTAKEVRAGRRKVDISVPEESGRLRLLRAFGHGPEDVTLRLNRANLAGECCFAALLRGAFLACATMTTPELNYHLEFSVGYRKLAGDLSALMREMDLAPKSTIRKGVHMLYFKDSGLIEDTLTAMGAQGASLDLMGIKMEKNMRNHVNRKVNFETANIFRAANAAAEQLEAVRQLRASHGFAALPESLREAAELREANPEATLAELCEEAEGEISRSGMSHRLKKLVLFSQNKKI
ncbi:MAG: DNA-binding protein WhiA [Oscillospiraceae bacterium]|jgi:DNA-binding protein WhiA|nr:DNA-binding protein WhiA [Oscillospiraceae bacterium]